MSETKIILDACCGSRMFWFDKENPLVLFADIRDEEHTLHQFVKNGIVASINTDDKGIFSTSLYNEYSLYASSASLIGVSDADIINNIKRIHINAENSRFRAPKLTL